MQNRFDLESQKELSHQEDLECRVKNCGCLYCINMAQKKKERRSPVNTAMNLQGTSWFAVRLMGSEEEISSATEMYYN